MQLVQQPHLLPNSRPTVQGDKIAASPCLFYCAHPGARMRGNGFEWCGKKTRGKPEIIHSSDIVIQECCCALNFFGQLRILLGGNCGTIESYARDARRGNHRARAAILS